MMTRRFLSLSLLCTLTACAPESDWREQLRTPEESHLPWREQFLLDGVDKLHREDVEKTLGQPFETHGRADGGNEAIYQHASFTTPGVTSEDPAPGTCTDYMVRYDAAGLLKQVRRKKC